MNDLLDMLDMGEYAAYIWASYGAAFVIFVATIIVTKKQQKSTRQQVEALRANRKNQS
jgi:heme exporter protein CcmD